MLLVVPYANSLKPSQKAALRSASQQPRAETTIHDSYTDQSDIYLFRLILPDMCNVCICFSGFDSRTFQHVVIVLTINLLVQNKNANSE